MSSDLTQPPPAPAGPPGQRGGVSPGRAAVDAPVSMPGASLGEPPAADESDEAPRATTSIASAAIASTAHRPSRWGVLRHAHYRNMLGAQFVSNVGGWMELFGMQWLVAQKTGSLSALAYLGAAQLVPIMVFGLLGGLAADRVNRKLLLIVTQTLLMVIAASVTLLAIYDFPATPAVSAFNRAVTGFLHIDAAPDVVAPLLILSILNGVVLAFNFPAWQVLTPRLVPREELTRAITLNGIAFNTSRIFGPVLAGGVMAVSGSVPLFMVNTISFLGVVITAMTTPDAPAPPPDGVHPVRQIWNAGAFVFTNRGPLAVFAATTLMSLLAAPLVRILPLFIIDVYQAPKAQEEWVGGCMLAFQGIGAVMGGVALKLIPAWYPKHHVIPIAVSCCGASMTVFAATSNLWAGYAVMVVIGFFWIWAFNQSWAAMQHLVSDAMRGRVVALANVFAFGATAAGNVLVGWLGEGLKSAHWSAGVATQVSVVALSAPLTVAGLFMLFKRTPEVDGLPRRAGVTSSLSVIEAITARSHRPARRSDRPETATEPTVSA